MLEEFFACEFGFAVEFDRSGNVALLVDRVAQVGRPEAVGGDRR